MLVNKFTAWQGLAREEGVSECVCERERERERGNDEVKRSENCSANTNKAVLKGRLGVDTAKAFKCGNSTKLSVLHFQKVYV